MKQATRPKNTAAAALTAAIASMTAGAFWSPPVTPKAHKRVPTMVRAPRAEIVAHNEAVAKRSDRLARIAARRRDHRLTREFADSGQHPKFAKQRVHKQHKHELRDAHGTFTLVGRNPDGTRRIWLAGISSQRGF